MMKYVKLCKDVPEMCAQRSMYGGIWKITIKAANRLPTNRMQLDQNVCGLNHAELTSSPPYHAERQNS